ncbi:ankyrin repeat domain-containing protein [Paenibacillus sp. MWE-103]|uniref:Ankyrin repeat domain-containing protein n=1 Tax=Paenibacillus artemisiicola TaxID=1172618 RepID=A0ABS3W669_9BACL|nr:ankyrin repeat domain-containing protein [Paenibacillus artemisiicola]MBO7743802.1 ankyrin repeat domain-containing protein [Paenibacillus artemisiicola]
MSQALIAAAGRGDAAEVRRLLAEGAEVNARDARGRTALLAATHAGDAEAARLLIDAGADLDLQDAILDNPFLYAGAQGRLEILKLLIAAGADAKRTNRYGGVALIPASEKGHAETVRTLLETTDVDVNHVNNLGWTALLEVAILSDGGPRHQEIARLLLQHGADPRLADRDGVTALRHAERNGLTEIARILRGAEPGAR